MTCLKNRRGTPHVPQENRRAAERRAAARVSVVETIKPSRPQGAAVTTKVRT
jgi:hypothetical protein